MTTRWCNTTNSPIALCASSFWQHPPKHAADIKATRCNTTHWVRQSYPAKQLASTLHIVFTDYAAREHRGGGWSECARPTEMRQRDIA